MKNLAQNQPVDTLYVNGAQIATRNQTGNINVSNLPLRIGGNALWGANIFQVNLMKFAFITVH